jgi:uncharacterized protein
MKLQSLSLADRELFQEFLGLKEHELSVYTFVNIYIWRRLFDIGWKIIDDNLCVFFRDRLSCFLYLPPLGLRLSPAAIEESFKLMDKLNKNPAISRIENLEAVEAGFLGKLGYRIAEKPGEYLYLRDSLAGLSGGSYKSKRAAVNFFTKHYKAGYLEFSPRHREGCLKLYKLWASGRSSTNIDPVYRGMLKDGLLCLGTLLRDYRKLGVAARVVEINGKIEAFTAGFALNPRIFCVLYEFADLSFKGSSQFIFRRLCREMEEYSFINSMDDSGLESLRKVKESYHPLKIIPSFIADRKNA